MTEELEELLAEEQVAAGTTATCAAIFQENTTVKVGCSALLHWMRGALSYAECCALGLSTARQLPEQGLGLGLLEQDLCLKVVRDFCAGPHGFSLAPSSLVPRVQGHVILDKGDFFALLLLRNARSRQLQRAAECIVTFFRAFQCYLRFNILRRYGRAPAQTFLVCPLLT